MTIKDSRLYKGKLTLGDDAAKLEAACQVSAVKISFDYATDGDTLVVLCGDEAAQQTTESAKLTFSAVQDWEDAAGLVAWTWDHALEEVPFSWQPNPTADIYSGRVQVKRLDVGGDVKKRLSSDAEWTILGDITTTPAPPPAPLSASVAEKTPHSSDRRAVTLTFDNSGTGNPVKVSWKASGQPETVTQPGGTGTADHTYTSADDGSVVITVTDSVDSTRTKTLTAITIPYTGS